MLYNEIQVFVLHNPVAKMRIMNTEHETVPRFSIFFSWLLLNPIRSLKMFAIHGKATACISSTMRVSSQNIRAYENERPLVLGTATATVPVGVVVVVGRVQGNGRSNGIKRSEVK